VESKRLITDLDGTVWLRIEDAGYMDDDGRIWLVGRVKWRVVGNGRSYWSTVVEQKVGWVGVGGQVHPFLNVRHPVITRL